MLVPKIKNIKNDKEKKTEEYDVVVDNIDDTVDLYGKYSGIDFENDMKEKKNFIKYVEKLVRNSFEYRSYIKYLKKELNITKCTFLSGVNIRENTRVRLEFHHYPFTLFDIVNIILQKHLANNEVRFNPFSLAEEVAKLHYENLIGLVPVSKTEHELIHSGKKFVNIKYILGAYKKFMKKFNIPQELLDNYMKLEDLSKREDNGETIDEVLNIKFLNLKLLGVEQPKKIEVTENEIA